MLSAHFCIKYTNVLWKWPILFWSNAASIVKWSQYLKFSIESLPIYANIVRNPPQAIVDYDFITVINCYNISPFASVIIVDECVVRFVLIQIEFQPTWLHCTWTFIHITCKSIQIVHGTYNAPESIVIRSYSATISNERKFLCGKSRQDLWWRILSSWSITTNQQGFFYELNTCVESFNICITHCMGAAFLLWDKRKTSINSISTNGGWFSIPPYQL